MPWTDCSRIDVKKSLMIVVLAISVVAISAVVCYAICSRLELDKTTSIIICGTVLLLEFVSFNVIQDYKSDSLYFKKDDENETYTIRAIKKGEL